VEGGEQNDVAASRCAAMCGSTTARFNAGSVVLTLRRVRDNHHADEVVRLPGHRQRPQERRGDRHDEAAVRLTLTLGMLPPAAASNEDAFFTKLVGTEPSVHVVKAQRPHRDRS
jgi:hypothetical protein